MRLCTKGPCPSNMTPRSKQLCGNVCPVCARRATFLLNIPTLTPDLPSHGEPPKETTLDRTLSLQSTLHKKTIIVKSTTANVSCIVLNRQEARWPLAATLPVPFDIVWN